MVQPGALDQLQHVHELNRAFLALLQTRVRAERPGFGLPAAAHAAVAEAGGALLDAVAAFPRTLFELESAPRARPHGAGVDAEVDEAEHDLCFSIVFAARQTSRQSAYQARLLFGLGPADVERLRSASLVDLQRLACTPGVLQCAFRERPWFWQTLFTATRPELRRQLTLMALQPGIAIGWPLRRPPQPIA